MPTINWLDPQDLSFPPLSQALDEPNGLLAVGGDLSIPRLLSGYRHGVFPWYEDPQPILWWSPDPRAVLYPHKIHISRSLAKRLRTPDYRVSADTAFERVVGHCAELSPKRTGTWITDDMRQAYTQLHRAGWAHSVEVWRDDELVGGLYGVAIGKVFFGESMFSRASDASKIAMVHLAGQLRSWNYHFIDCQVGNAHLYRMGAEDIDREAFSEQLAKYARTEADEPGRWALDWQYEP